MAVQPVAATDPQSFEQVLLGMPSVGKTARGIQVCPVKNFPHSLACFAESMTCTSRAATSCGSIASASAAANMSLAGATLAATRCGGGQLQSGSAVVHPARRQQFQRRCATKDVSTTNAANFTYTENL